MNESSPARYRDRTVAFRSTVTAVRRLGDSLIHISSTMPANVELSPGDTFALEVAPGADGPTLRRYTVSTTSSDAFDVVAFLTRRGPATSFLEGVEVGDELVGQGPERPVRTGAEAVTIVAVVGDATGVGTARSVAASSGLPIALGLKACGDVGPVLEVLGLPAATSLADDAAANAWLTALVDQHGVENVALVAIGEQAANNSIRQHALGLGIGRERVATRTFWRPDRAGLE